MDESLHQAGFGIYIHWPFCQSKCPYCDFNSHVVSGVNQREWAKAFVSELERYKSETPERVVSSVFFGGGTPSLMEPELVETILTCISENWTFARGAEITLEANPSSVEAGKFRDFRSAGVNRISLGIQALNDHDLSKLGRLHSRDEGYRAIEIAQNTFTRVSFDLIYARQDQGLKDWEAELTKALSLGTEHLSLYQLTIEEDTAFGKRHAAGKLIGLPEDNLAADMYALTQEICEAADMPAYEISNHARSWAQSQHNLIYWRGGDYLGIGPGAHGRLRVNGKRCATDTELLPQTWLAAATAGLGEASRTELSAYEQGVEYLLMALRLTEGVDLTRASDFDPDLLNSNKYNELVDMGFLASDQSRLYATPQGRMVLNAILRELLKE